MLLLTNFLNFNKKKENNSQKIYIQLCTTYTTKKNQKMQLYEMCYKVIFCIKLYELTIVCLSQRQYIMSEFCLLKVGIKRKNT